MHEMHRTDVCGCIFVPVYECRDAKSKEKYARFLVNTYICIRIAVTRCYISSYFFFFFTYYTQRLFLRYNFLYNTSMTS